MDIQFIAMMILCIGFAITLGVILALFLHDRKGPWETGKCLGRDARRHRVVGIVQIALWEKNEPGYQADTWREINSRYWEKFEKSK